MTNWKKLLLSTATLTLAGSLLVACGGGSEKKEAGDTMETASGAKTLKIWVPTGATESYQAVVDEFTKETGYEVEIIDIEDPKAQEMVKKDPSTAADVFAMPHDQLGQLVKSGVIQELPEQYTSEIASWATDQAITGAQFEGKTYAFPYGIESQVLYYNKSKLTEDDVKTYEAITEKGKFGATFKAMNAYATGPLFMSVGNTLFGENGEDPKGTNWGNEAGVSVLKWVYAQNDNPGFVNLDAANVISQFGDGSVDAILDGPWNYNAVKEAVGEDNLGVAVYPRVMIGGEEVQQKAFMGVKLYAVNQAPSNGDVERIAAAYKLAAAITGAESQKNQFEKRAVVPSNKEVQASDAVQSHPLAQAVIAMGSSSDYTVVMPKLSQMGVFWTEAAAILSDTYNGDIKESDYLTRLQQFDADIAAAE